VAGVLRRFSPFAAIETPAIAAEVLHHYDIGFFYRHARKAEKTFRHLSFIEPRYLPPGVDDDHPPHASMNGEHLIAKIYNAIRANAELWNTTLLIILYDEHGGFFDHESPLAATPPDDHKGEYTFDRLGVRVPAVLRFAVGGERGFFPRYAITRACFVIHRQMVTAATRQRTAGANSFASIIARREGRARTRPLPSRSSCASSRALTKPRWRRRPLSDNQRAIISFSQYPRKPNKGQGRQQGQTEHENDERPCRPSRHCKATRAAFF